MFEEVLSKSAKESLAILSKSRDKACDIAVMKILAISERGTKRDFVDLYFMLKKKYSSLEESLNLYERKFKKLEQNKFHLIKSLTYFRDAEEEKMPKMLVEVNWTEIKRFFEKEVKKLSKVILE